jgi:hypothetical protein
MFLISRLLCWDVASPYCQIIVYFLFSNCRLLQKDMMAGAVSRYVGGVKDHTQYLCVSSSCP